MGRSRRAQLLELGVGLVVVAGPLVFNPRSATPFAEPKVVVLLAACLCIWLSRPSADRRIAIAAAAWVGALAVATWFGVDRWISVAGTDDLPNGLLLLASCAFLLAIGTRLPPSLIARIPRWLFATSIPVALVAIAYRFAPGAVESVTSGLPMDGSTLGHPVFLAGMTAIGAVAATEVVSSARARWLTIAGVVVVTTALSISTKRAGLVALAIGLIVAWLRARRGTDRQAVRRVALVAGVVVATTIGWMVVAPLVPTSQPLSGVTRFDELATDSSRARVLIAGVLVRASADRPVLGWGPGNTGSAYLAHASATDVALAQRGIPDAHDLILETLVTSGVVGLMTFLVLLLLVALAIRRAWRDPRVAWAAAVAIGLFAFHLMQPINPAMTPLLFLAAGIAARSPSAPETSPTRPKVVSIALAVPLAAGLAFALLLAASSTLEQVGKTYNSQWALRSAVSIAPGRISPAKTLAFYLAEDASSVGGAAAESRTLIDDTVARHPWSPSVRFIGVQAGLIMNDPAVSRMWLRDQLDTFPVDASWLPESALRFADGGPIAPTTGFDADGNPTAATEAGSP
jgi:O-antigen ligase